MKKRKTNYRKYVVYAILFLVAIGFTIPGFLDFGDEQNQGPAPVRVCQSDQDCYLLCDDQPVASLCYQNICQQNACYEQSFYPYQDAQNRIDLEIIIAGEQLDLQERFTELNLPNFFVEFNQDFFITYAPNLTLNHIFDKLQLKLTAQCLFVGEASYCQNKEHQLTMFINDNQSYSWGEYQPQNNDQIKIIYR